MKELVRLWKRPSYDGSKFTYYLLYTDEHGRRRQKSLGHTDTRKAERQRGQLERDLRMGIIEPGSMRLNDFLDDCVNRTRGQVRETTLREYGSSMRHFISVIGNIDFRRVEQKHGERFLQACLDKGNRPATAGKKIGTLKRLFQLAVERDQIEKNPFKYIRKPKVAKRKIRIYTDNECIRLIEASRLYQTSRKNYQTFEQLKWDLLILTALCTGMRRGELLNTTWSDIDFERRTVEVSPKNDTEHTWEWHIKDTDRRLLPLTDDIVGLLAKRQVEQPEGYPYVFIPLYRYDYILKLRQQGRWSARKGNYPTNNFDRQFRAILKMAGIEQGEFHDFRRTCLSKWFANGLKEYDVTKMAGHANFETTHSFYLAIREDLVDRTRRASTDALKGISVAKVLQQPFEP